MCNLYSMTANVGEVRRLFGPFRGDTWNFPAVGEIYPGRLAPVLRRDSDGALGLVFMAWGSQGRLEVARSRTFAIYRVPSGVRR